MPPKSKKTSAGILLYRRRVQASAPAAPAVVRERAVTVGSGYEARQKEAHSETAPALVRDRAVTVGSGYEARQNGAHSEAAPAVVRDRAVTVGSGYEARQNEAHSEAAPAVVPDRAVTVGSGYEARQNEAHSQAAPAVVRDRAATVGSGYEARQNGAHSETAPAVVHDPDDIEVLLVHPGGPFWAKKDSGAWSIPKGEYPADEDPLSAAIRELEEETGFRAEGSFVNLGQATQRGGKIVSAFAYEAAVEADFDPAHLRSNTFSMEWPPRSGKIAEFPEVDRAAWFSISEARERIIEAQRPFLDRVLTLIPGLNQAS